MSEATKPTNEEIDLFTFLQPVTNFFKLIFYSIGRYLQLIYKNISLLLLLTFFTSALGFSLRFILPKAFKTEAVFVSHELPAKLCVILLNNLEELVATKKNKPVLANQLKISTNIALSIVSIKANLMKDSFFVNDQDTIRNFFTVTLVCDDADITEKIQTGIVQYFENNSYAFKRREAKRLRLTALKNNFANKLKSLDSLKVIVNNSIIPRSTGQGIILGEPIDPVSVYQAALNYYREELDIDLNLSILDNIEIIQPFITTIKPNYPNFKLLLLYSFFAGILLSLIIIPIRKNKSTVLK